MQDIISTVHYTGKTDYDDSTVIDDFIYFPPAILRLHHPNIISKYVFFITFILIIYACEFEESSILNFVQK